MLTARKLPHKDTYDGYGALLRVRARTSANSNAPVLRRCRCRGAVFLSHTFDTDCLDGKNELIGVQHTGRKGCSRNLPVAVSRRTRLELPGMKEFWRHRIEIEGNWRLQEPQALRGKHQSSSTVDKTHSRLRFCHRRNAKAAGCRSIAGLKLRRTYNFRYRSSGITSTFATFATVTIRRDMENLRFSRLLVSHN